MFYRNANSADPDQMLHSAASDLGLYCLPITLFLRFSRVKWVKQALMGEQESSCLTHLCQVVNVEQNRTELYYLTTSQATCRRLKRSKQNNKLHNEQSK